MRLEGGCHCGQLRVAFTTAKAPTELPLRACQCTFCRRHGGLTTSDPEGEVLLTVAEVPAGGWYRFGMGLTDFWVCPRCGVYVGAYVEVDGQGRAVVNTTRVHPGPGANGLRAGDPRGPARASRSGVEPGARPHRLGHAHWQTRAPLTTPSWHVPWQHWMSVRPYWDILNAWLQFSPWA